jgi:hypothetical protein
MRTATIFAMLAGACACSGGMGGGGLGGGGGGGGGCTMDSDCSPEVCARDGECLPSSEVTAGRVTWTVLGSQANGSSCSTIPSLYLQFFSGPNDGVGFSPVPCAEGNFSIDKLPSRFNMVEIGIDNGADLGDTTFDGSGNATFNLVP